MKTSKSVVCKCERCNKPFKAYTHEDKSLCKACKAVVNEEKLKSITGQSVPKTMTRRIYDAAVNSTRDLDIVGRLLRAELEAEENRENSAFEKRVCKDCGEEFTITVGEKEFYESKNLLLPVRCCYCRKNRKYRVATITPEGGGGE